MCVCVCVCVCVRVCVRVCVLLGGVVRGELCSFVVTLILNGGEYWLRLWTVNCLNWFFEPAVTGCVLVCVVNVCVNVVLYGVEKFIFDFVAAIVNGCV